MLLVKSYILLCILQWCTCLLTYRTRQFTVIEEWPFIAAIIISPNTEQEHIGGVGVFVSKNCVLAHPNAVTVTKNVYAADNPYFWNEVGMYGLLWRRREISEIEIGYGSANKNNFLRTAPLKVIYSGEFRNSTPIIVLESPVEFSLAVQLALMAETLPTEPYDSLSCKTAGWCEVDDLMEMELFVFHEEACPCNVKPKKFCSDAGTEMRICPFVDGTPLVCQAMTISDNSSVLIIDASTKKLHSNIHSIDCEEGTNQIKNCAFNWDHISNNIVYILTTIEQHKDDKARYNRKKYKKIHRQQQISQRHQ